MSTPRRDDQGTDADLHAFTGGCRSSGSLATNLKRPVPPVVSRSEGCDGELRWQRWYTGSPGRGQRHRPRGRGGGRRHVLNSGARDIFL